MIGHGVRQPLEDDLLDVEVFVGRLNHEVGCLKALDFSRVGDTVDDV